MGDRSQIVVSSAQFDSPIVFYGHWSGEDNLAAVRNVLARTDRVGDPSYLTAQVFYEFAVNLGRYDGDLSFGISAQKNPEDSWMDNVTVYLNADTGVVTYTEDPDCELCGYPHDHEDDPYPTEPESVGDRLDKFAPQPSTSPQIEGVE